MMLGAAVSPAMAVPARDALGSWQASLGAWALPAVVAAVAWVPVARRVNEREPAGESRPGRLPWRSRPAWLLAAFMSAQSALAYAYLGWLAPAYESRGWSAATTGALLGALHLPSSSPPSRCPRSRSDRGIADPPCSPPSPAP